MRTDRGCCAGKRFGEYIPVSALAGIIGFGWGAPGPMFPSGPNPCSDLRRSRRTIVSCRDVFSAFMLCFLKRRKQFDKSEFDQLNKSMNKKDCQGPISSSGEWRVKKPDALAAGKQIVLCYTALPKSSFRFETWTSLDAGSIWKQNLRLYEPPDPAVLESSTSNVQV